MSEFVPSRLAPEPRIALLVLGMHRSGTSAFARVLNQLGAGLPKNLLPPSEANTAGHWEPERLVQLNETILGDMLSGWDDWAPIEFNRLSPAKRAEHSAHLQQEILSEFQGHQLFVLKDPRISRLAPLYLEALSAMQIEPRIVLPIRNPLAVAASLMSRNHIDASTAQLFWLRYVLDSENSTRGLRREFVEYEALMRDWRAVSAQLRDALDLPIAEPELEVQSEIDKFLQQDLQHFNATNDQLDADPSVLPWVRDAYRALIALSRDESDAKARAALDGVAAAFDDETRLFAPLAARMRGDSLRAHYRVWELEQETERQKQETTQAQGALAEAQRALADASRALSDFEHMLSNTKRELADTQRVLVETEQKSAAQLQAANEATERTAKERDVLAGDLLLREGRIAELGRALEKAHADIEYVRQSYLQSTSWKITAPLRALTSLARGIKTEPAANPANASSQMPVNGLLRALKFHGAHGAISKALHVARTRGALAMLRQGLKTIQLHAAAGHRAADAGPQQFLDERLEFTVQLGQRPAPALPSDPSVLIISETDLDQCIRYRIRNKIETFEAHGVRAGYGDIRDLFGSLSEMQFYRTLLIYRAPMHDLFMTYHNEARRLGMSILYDLDDPIFDASVLGGNANLKAIESHYRTGQLRDTSRFRQAMEASDYLLASTPGLADLMRRSVPGKDVFVWRNTADQRSLKVGASISAHSPRTSERTLIGYFSGSLAHEADFDQAAGALATILRQRPETDLLLFGHTRPRAELNAFGERIQTEKFSDYERYLEAVARCDVVIIPLVDDAFNRCKSVVRYLDAAIVQTPVIASAVGDYAELVRHGETGWLARSKADWAPLLDAVCADTRLRQSVGRRAREFVEAEFSTTSNMPDLSSELRSLVFGDARAHPDR
ncbi:MAG: glycosyltransferase [Hyphomonadaceae bacterium]|nr:glycosyltransferase [Hyphomonadaceae bacterium]